MRALFDRLFDDAALFPPGDAPMAVAVPAHRRLRNQMDRLLGPFVVPAARLDELVGQGAAPSQVAELLADRDGAALASEGVRV